LRLAYVQRKVLVAMGEKSKRNVLPPDQSEVISDPPYPVREAAGAAGSPEKEHLQGAADGPRPFGLIWIYSPHPVVAMGLEQTLEGRAQVYSGLEAPTDMPSCAILDASGEESLSEGIRRIQEVNRSIAIIVLGLNLDLPLAKTALRAGARGFIHAGMRPDQIVRAIEVATAGEIVAPRKLLEYMITYQEPATPDVLTSRHREILELVVEGLSNAQIARRLDLSESTVKQHLHHAYKLLGVKNRTKAAKLFRSKGVLEHDPL
jgi:DNA-binding NarL/FixJ family response regulator